MCFILMIITIVLGFFVSISPLFFFESIDAIQLILTMFGGIFVIILSIICIRSSNHKFNSTNTQSHPKTVSPAWNFGQQNEKIQSQEKATSSKKSQLGLIASGIYVMIIGAVYLLSQSGCYLLGAGFLIVILAGISARIGSKPSIFRIFADDGNVLMETSRIYREGECIVIRGKILGSMSIKAFLRPGQIWNIFSLITPSVILYLPLIILKGLIESRGEVE